MSVSKATRSTPRPATHPTTQSHTAQPHTAKPTTAKPPSAKSTTAQSHTAQKPTSHTAQKPTSHTTQKPTSHTTQKPTSHTTQKSTSHTTQKSTQAHANGTPPSKSKWTTAKNDSNAHLPSQAADSFSKEGYKNFKSWEKTGSKTWTPKGKGNSPSEATKPEAAKPEATKTTNSSKLAKLVPNDVKLFEAKSPELGGQVWQKSGSFGGPNSVVGGSGSISALEAKAQGTASASFDPKKGTFDASVSGSANLNLVHAQGELHTNFGTTATGDATIGANANGKANVTIDPLHGTVDAGAHLDAFAGVQAGGEISQTVGPATGTVSGHVEAGIGANLDASVGINHGKVEAKFDVGAALGVGGDVGFDVSVDVPGAVKDIGHAASAVGNFASNAFHSIFG